jgi:hypothetical protein
MTHDYSPHVPDPATDSERVMIAAALQQVQAGIRQARRAIASGRPSDEYVTALMALDEAQRALDRAIAAAGPRN